MPRSLVLSSMLSLPESRCQDGVRSASNYWRVMSMEGKGQREQE